MSAGSRSRHAHAARNKLAGERYSDLPVGAAVILTLDDQTQMATSTRSRPWQTGDGTWLVLVEGKVGGWDLSRVRPAA